MSGSLHVCVLGGGSFGTALANIVASNGHNTRLWMRDESRARHCQETRENTFYLPGHQLHDSLVISSNLEASLARCNIIVLAIPSQSFREVAKKISSIIPSGATVISTTKGIEQDSFSLMSEVLEQELSDAKVGALSGPNFAAEIINNQYTGSVIASSHCDVTSAVQEVFSSATFKVYRNKDIYGVELGGALKNIYAIVTGMAAALGCKQNTQAMLLTRSLAEMSRLATALGADSKTFLGLSGVGDLILTCSSNLSRNYRLGYAVGKGSSLTSAMSDIGQAVEGVPTLKIVKQKSDDLDIYMPLVDGLHAVLFEGQQLNSVIHNLMTGGVNLDVD